MAEWRCLGAVGPRAYTDQTRPKNLTVNRLPSQSGEVAVKHVAQPYTNGEFLERSIDEAFPLQKMLPEDLPMAYMADPEGEGELLAVPMPEDDPSLSQGESNASEEPTLTFARAEFPDGSIFEGQFCGQNRHGWGRFTWTNGGTFEGQFDNNDMHGEGTYRWSDGSSYVGQWQRNEMGPQGVMRWTDGRRYEGHFDSGKKHGEGQLVWPDGRMYEGQWHSGKQHGIGLTVTGAGVIRVSEWEHGKLKQWHASAEEATDRAEVQVMLKQAGSAWRRTCESADTGDSQSTPPRQASPR